MRISPDEIGWRKKHLRIIQTCLEKAPFFDDIFPLVEAWLTTEYSFLVDLNIAGIKMIAQILQLEPEFVRASDLQHHGQSTRLLLNLCQQVGVDHYYSSLGSKDYMEPEEYLFSEAGISLTYQHWEHPTYPQRGNDFVSHLSVIDALMNVGPEAVRSFIA
jgi:hypothetical protein